MASYDVKLLYAGQSGTGQANKKTYVGVYRVITDDPTVGQTQIENAPGLPFYGAFFKFGAAVDPLARCVSKNPSRVDGTRLVWLVEVTWERPDQNDTNNDEPRPDENGNNSDDPDKWRDKWEWVGSKITAPLETAVLLTDQMPHIRAKGKDGPVVNAAGDAFDPPAEKDVTNTILRITKFEKNFPVDTQKEYKDSINADRFTIRKPGLNLVVEPFTCKMEPITGGLQWHRKQDGKEVPYVQINYELNINDAGWRFNLLNRGIHRRVDEKHPTNDGRTVSPGDFGGVDIFTGESIGPDIAPIDKILDASGEPITEPQNLGWDGQPLKDQRNPIFIPYGGYKELPYAKLGL